MADRIDLNDLIAKEREKLQQKVERGAFENLQRGAGLAARAVGPVAAGAALGAAAGAPFAGIGAIPGALAGATSAALAQPLSDVAVTAWNALTRQNQPVPSQAMEELMTRAGLPEPASATERLMSAAARAATEAPLGAAAARNVAQALPMTSQVARPVMQTLAAAPGMQTASATTGSVATQGAIEAGVPAGLALPLGIVAGAIPAIRPGGLFPATGGEVRQSNVSLLEQAGIPVTPAQKSGNPSAQVFESVMKYLPTSAPRVARAEDEQMRAFTRNIMRNAGIDSDVATPEVLTKARQGFRTEYKQLEQATPIRGDEQLFNDLSAIENQYVRGFQDVAPAWQRMRDTVLDYASGKAGEGIDYQRMQSRISEEIARAQRSDSPNAQFWREALQGLQRSLGNAMERSAGSPELRSAWQDVNRRYAIFSRIEDTMARAGQEKLNTGFIPPQQIAAVERGRNPQMWAEGGNPFTDLVRAGAAILPDPVPNSGTTQRSFAQDILTGGKRGAPVAAAGSAAQGLGVATIDPLLSLGIPYAVARQWYGAPIRPELQGLLGVQAARGATEAE